MSQGGSLGDHDFATSIDFDAVVIGGIWIAICLGNVIFIAVQHVQALLEPTLPLTQRKGKLIAVSLNIVMGCFKEFTVSAQLIHAFTNLACCLVATM